MYLWSVIVLSFSHTCKVVGDIACPGGPSDSGECPHPHEADDGEHDQISVLQPPVAKDLAKFNHFVFSLHGDSEICNWRFRIVGTKDLLPSRQDGVIVTVIGVLFERLHGLFKGEREREM